MDRALPMGNKICARREERRKHDLHRERIRNMKPLVNTSEPAVWSMDHVRNNLKREQMLEERYSEIDRENRILLDKMSVIMRDKTLPSPRYKESRGPVSLNRDFRKKELIRITKENQAILKRIQQAQPIYNHVQWEGDHKRQKEYLTNCCEYPLVLKKPMPPTSQLVPLGADDPEMQAQDASQPMPSGNAVDDMKYVLKEGQRIGEKYYLVEMSTDGRTLVITAYDGDAEQTFELVVKEKHHRKLYRESNGDYSIIAGKLRVEGDKLIIWEEAKDTLPPIPGAARQEARSKPSPAAELPPMEDPPQTASTIDADEMCVRHDVPGSVGSVNVELGFSETCEAKMHIRGLTPVTPPSLGSTTQSFYVDKTQWPQAA